MIVFPAAIVWSSNNNISLLNFYKHFYYIFSSLYMSSLYLFPWTAHESNLVKRSLKSSIPCQEGAKFYRNPDRPTNKIWTNFECSKYYLCLDGEVFEFKCSVGLLFDVSRQICDFKQNVDNCDITAGKCNWLLKRRIYLHVVEVMRKKVYEWMCDCLFECEPYHRSEIMRYDDDG